MDFNSVKELGLSASTIVTILGLAVWLVKKNVTILEKQYESHEKERAQWMASYVQIMEKVDKGMGYMREEHQAHMQAIKEVLDHVKA